MTILQNVFVWLEQKFDKFRISRGGGHYTNVSITLIFQFLRNIKHWLRIEYPVYIWQALQLFSCGDTRHIWISFQKI